MFQICQTYRLVTCCLWWWSGIPTMLDWLLTMKYRGYAKSPPPTILHQSKKQDFVQAYGPIRAVQLEYINLNKCVLRNGLWLTFIEDKSVWTFTPPVMLRFSERFFGKPVTLYQSTLTLTLTLTHTHTHTHTLISHRTWIFSDTTVRTSNLECVYYFIQAKTASDPLIIELSHRKCF
jgi:hypothetical protein